MGTQELAKTLKLFNEKVDRLDTLSFFKSTPRGAAIVEFDRGKGWDSVFIGPQEESVEALVLTLRLFMQDNDRISLRKLRTLYEDSQLDAQFKARFESTCTELNRFLDSDTNLSIEDGHQLTYRDILNVFVYGTYAHVNDSKRAVFEGIRTTPFFPAFQTRLVESVWAFRHALVQLRTINTDVITTFGSAHSSASAV